MNKGIKHSYVYVLSLIEYDGALPFEIIPNHFFDRVNQDQIKELNELNEAFTSKMHSPVPYEYDLIEKVEGTSKHQSYEHLPPEKWRYWVINFTGYNTELQRLEIAFELVPQEVRFGYSILHDEKMGEILGYNAARINSYLLQSPIPRNRITRVSDDDLREIGQNYQYIKSCYDDQNSIWIALLRYHLLRTLPENSEIRLIGLFAVIEVLITHRPKLVESLDSITHQMFSKISLLNNRSKDELPYDEYFGELKPKKVWSLLYEYRSRIVHGDWVNFVGILAPLRSLENTYTFVDIAVKMLLKQAILEPDLIIDLKKC